MTACAICGNDKANRLHYPREMMFGMDEAFEYLECGRCGCLQITRVPEDLARYYPRDYYSYRPPKEKRQAGLVYRLRAARTRAFLGERTLLGSLLASLSGRAEHFDWLARGRVGLDSAIVDIGCGTGGLLLKLHREGFRNLLGVDPFIEYDIDYGNGVRVLRKHLGEVRQSFDFVMLHHSFEHMPDCLGSLRQLRRIVREGGTLLLRIPVADSYARRKYGVHWAAWDAPRHLYLHTVKSLHLAASATGFEVREVTYDSTKSQFVGSELYLRGIPAQQAEPYQFGKPNSIFTREEWNRFLRAADELNALRDGDTACFYLGPR